MYKLEQQSGGNGGGHEATKTTAVTEQPTQIHTPQDEGGGYIALSLIIIVGGFIGFVLMLIFGLVALFKRRKR